MNKNAPPPEASGQLLDEYWDSIRRGRFVVSECESCKHRFLPPRRWCPNCAAGNVRWFDSEGSGELYSFTEIPSASPQTPSSVVGLATLDDLSEGSRFYGSVVDIAPAAVLVGMRVRVQIRPFADGGMLPVLVPVGKEAG